VRDESDGLTLVLFGPVGDLAERMLLPELWHAHCEGLLPSRWRLVGTARSELSDADFRETTRKALDAADAPGFDDDTWADFAARLTYCAADLVEGDGKALAAAVRDGEDGSPALVVHYLSTPPPTFAPVTERLSALGLLDGASVIYEKPYGLDLRSFDELEAVVTARLDEAQIFRLDHFLGKAALREVSTLRRDHPALEAAWSAEHVLRVEIDVPETLGVGERAGFYDDAGALRDVVVTHLFQVAAVVAMDLPDAPSDLAARRSAVLDDLRPLSPDDVVLGQYAGYLDLDGVDRASITETFAAVSLRIDSRRWAGVPFHLRHGKRLAAGGHRLAITFDAATCATLEGDGLHLEDGALVIDLSRPSTVPEPGERAGVDEDLGDHERLLLEAIAGDHRWFADASGLRRGWQVVDDVLADRHGPDLYEQGSWGPAAATELIAPHHWTLGS
jgi:glucose-6-phosphate 1-dehydrogenase